MNSQLVVMEQSKTLWMGNIETYMDEPYLMNYFSDEEGLLSIKIIKDKNTGIPAGYAFVDFVTTQNAKKFLEKYSNRPMPGSSVPFRLNWAQYSGGKSGGPEYSLFIGDIAADTTEAQITRTFKLKYPSVLGMKIVADPITGQTKGYGFIRFSNEREANMALEEMQGVYIGSKPIRISKAVQKNSAIKDEVEVVPQIPSTSIDWTQYLYNQSSASALGNPMGMMDPNQLAAYEYHQKCYSLFNSQNQYPPTSDTNFFVRQHDIYTDNSNFATERVGTLISDLTSTSFTKIQKY